MVKNQAMEPVEISERAAEEIKIIMQSDAIPDEYCLRIGMNSEGCGSKLAIGFDEQKEGDICYTRHDIPILIEKKHLLYVIGRTVDYREEGETWGFVFNEPEAKRT